MTLPLMVLTPVKANEMMCATCGTIFRRPKNCGKDEWLRRRFCSVDCRLREGKKRRSTCRAGHDLTVAENRYEYKSGHRRCRICARDREARVREANRTSSSEPKVCTRCKELLPATSFPSRRGRPGPKPTCHACCRAISRETRAKDPERVRATQRRNYYKTQDASIERAAAWNERNKAHRLNLHLIKTYGITLADLERMEVEQDSRCAACLQPETVINARSKKPQRLAIDHNHETGEIRGLLCTGCNVALGLLQDSAERVDLLASYRRRYG